MKVKKIYMLILRILEQKTRKELTKRITNNLELTNDSNSPYSFLN